MREIVLDTETTGLNPKEGHRLIEIGCIEIINFVPTGRVFHQYFNPERSIPLDAFRIHGISDEFLKDKPLFESCAQEFLDFISDSPLVIHNAEFDLKFLNSELERASLPPILSANVIDTLSLARRKHPGLSNSLDALCQRYNVDYSARNKHGALLDVRILAQVYLALHGGPQAAFSLAEARRAHHEDGSPLARPRPNAHPVHTTPQEEEAHHHFLEKLGPTALWNLYK